jgi:hypothetical protein
MRSTAASWGRLRRRIIRLGAQLDVVVRSDPEVCGLSGDDFTISLHHSGQGDCTVRGLNLVDCPNDLVIEEFERWLRDAGYLDQPTDSPATD